MKPTKNKVFCTAAMRTKMLFPTEGKAMNFIKFNANTILEEEGFAPTRAYYCDACCGFHVTSSSITDVHYTYIGKKDINSFRTDKEIEVIKDISKAFEFIKMAGSAFKDKLYFDSRRFLCYAEYYLKKHENTYVQYERNMQLQALASDHLKNLINRIMRERKQFGNAKDKTIKRLIKDQAASVECKEVDADGKYTIRCIPELMFQNAMQPVYVYKLWRGRLTPKEYEETLLANNMSDNERIDFIHENIIGIVDAVRDDTLKRKSQYHSIKELFKNLVIASYIDCKKLKVYELGAQSHRPFYFSPYRIDSWLRLRNVNLHLFNGMHKKYTCLITNSPIDADRRITIVKYKKVKEDKAKQFCE